MSTSCASVGGAWCEELFLLMLHAHLMLNCAVSSGLNTCVAADGAAARNTSLGAQVRVFTVARGGVFGRQILNNRCQLTL